MFIAVFFYLFGLNAQVKLKVEPGVLLETDSENLGLLLNIEPHVKASEKTVIGLRFGIALNPQKINIDNDSSFFIDELDDNGIISFVPTFDYYFNINRLKPYLGLGTGYYLFNNIDVSNRNTALTVEGNVKNQLGFLIRGGLQLGNTRFGLAYNFIPKADIKIPDDQIIGTIDNSYLGLSIGFILVGKEKFEE